MELTGQGWGAKVYKLDDKTALRRVKVYPNDEFDKSQDCWTELEFYEFINKLEPEYKKHFMRFIQYFYGEPINQTLSHCDILLDSNRVDI